MVRSGFLILLFSLNLALNAQKPDSVSYFTETFQYEKAIRLLEQVAKPTLSQVVKLADLHKQMRHYEKAIGYYQQVLKADSLHFPTVVNLAQLYQNAGLTGQSLFMVDRAIRISPVSYLHLLKAELFFQAEKYRESITQYNRLLESDSTGYLLRQIAYANEKLGKTPEAINYLETSLKKSPWDLPAVIKLTNLYLQQDSVKKALKLIHDASVRHPLQPQVLRLKAYCNYRADQFQSAIVDFNRCLALDDSSDFVTDNLGYAYYRSGNFRKSLPFILQTYQRDTLSYAKTRLLGNVYSAIYLHHKALIYYFKAKELITPSPEEVLSLTEDIGLAYFNSGKFDQALIHLKQAVQLAPSKPMLYYYIARSYDDLNDHKNALASYEKYLEVEKKLGINDGGDTSENVRRRVKALREELFFQNR